MLLSGVSPDSRLVEIVELRDHPWFVASQFHPEFKSRPERPHPLFHGFVATAIALRDGVEPVLTAVGADAAMARRRRPSRDADRRRRRPPPPDRPAQRRHGGCRAPHEVPVVDLIPSTFELARPRSSRHEAVPRHRRHRRDPHRRPLGRDRRRDDQPVPVRQGPRP